jgi:hypothetical protein
MGERIEVDARPLKDTLDSQIGIYVRTTHKEIRVSFLIRGCSNIGVSETVAIILGQLLQSTYSVANNTLGTIWSDRQPTVFILTRKTKKVAESVRRHCAWLLETLSILRENKWGPFMGLALNWLEPSYTPRENIPFADKLSRSAHAIDMFKITCDACARGEGGIYVEPSGGYKRLMDERWGRMSLERFICKEALRPLGFVRSPAIPGLVSGLLYIHRNLPFLSDDQRMYLVRLEEGLSAQCTSMLFLAPAPLYHPIDDIVLNGILL